MPHGIGAIVEVCGEMCSARFGEERLIERAFISHGYPLDIEVVEGTPAVESECISHIKSEQLFVSLMMRPRNVGVAHVRACRNHWNHTHGHARAAQEAQEQNAARDISGTQIVTSLAKQP